MKRRTVLRSIITHPLSSRRRIAAWCAIGFIAAGACAWALARPILAPKPAWLKEFESRERFGIIEDGPVPVAYQHEADYIRFDVLLRPLWTESEASELIAYLDDVPPPAGHDGCEGWGHLNCPSRTDCYGRWFVWEEAMYAINSRIYYKAPINPGAMRMLCDRLLEGCGDLCAERRKIFALTVVETRLVDQPRFAEAVERLRSDPDPDVAYLVGHWLKWHKERARAGQARELAINKAAQ